jgi:hypothetical protein
MVGEGPPEPPPELEPWQALKVEWGWALHHAGEPLVALAEVTPAMPITDTLTTATSATVRVAARIDLLRSVTLLVRLSR